MEKLARQSRLAGTWQPSWERWWAGIGGTPGGIVWDADAGDLTAGLEHFAALFGQRLPVVDFGCGDGRQTRVLGRHFATVLGVDISPAAIGWARAADNPPTSAIASWMCATLARRPGCTVSSAT